MVAEHSQAGDGRARPRLVDVTTLARKNLETIADWGVDHSDTTEGEEAAERFYEAVLRDPEAAAWHARSYGYDEGRADATEEIVKLQGRIKQLEQHSLSERLFTIMLRLDERIGTIERAILGTQPKEA